MLLSPCLKLLHTLHELFQIFGQKIPQNLHENNLHFWSVMLKSKFWYDFKVYIVIKRDTEGT